MILNSSRRPRLARRIVCTVLALALTACAAAHAPPGPGPTEPALDNDHFVTADGTRLHLRSWRPDGPPKAVVVALHGFNDHSRAFDAVPAAPGTGPYLAAQGIAVYAYDQRSFGHSPYAGVWAGADALIADLRDAVRLVRNRHPGAPVYVLGESMGGAVVMAALSRPNAPEVAGAILVAPAVWARSTMPLFYRTALWLGARLAPSMKPSGRGLGRQASDNIEMLRQNARDPLFIKNTRIDAIAGLTDLMDEALASPPAILGPVLYLYGAKDEIIPKDATLKAIESFAKNRAQLRTAYYATSWHMMLRDLGGATPLADVAAFINGADGALPSGADADARGRLAAAVKK